MKIGPCGRTVLSSTSRVPGSVMGCILPTPTRPHGLIARPRGCEVKAAIFVDHATARCIAQPHDGVDHQHRNYINEFFRALMQEKAEIKEAQKKAEIRLQTMTKLATHVIEHFNNLPLPHPQAEGLRAVTLRSGT
ncbi:hypothetical protein PIB30_061681 [Stylosanthes scabra]|uniref:Uncharacterized protein n=1 Tax=Stylosanthes scabra TaxID=79078 RepID=A0ABU6WJ86_9FABA|nr:hypothetical protein [Stylosanthes scabra]